MENTLNKEAAILPERKIKRSPYTYLLLRRTSDGATVFEKELRSRVEVADFLRSRIGDLDKFIIYKAVGTVGVKERRDVEFEL